MGPSRANEPVLQASIKARIGWFRLHEAPHEVNFPNKTIKKKARLMNAMLHLSVYLLASKQRAKHTPEQETRAARVF